MTAPPQKTCTECNLIGPREEFAVGKRICLKCHSARVMRSKGRTANVATTAGELDIKVNRKRKRTDADAFDSRDSLSSMLKENLQRAVDDANDQVDFAKARLEQARKSKHPKLIQDAAKALDSALQNHTAINTRLMDKLSALEDLRAQAEKAKPCTFYFNAYPPVPVVLPTREVPAHFYPDAADDQ